MRSESPVRRLFAAALTVAFASTWTFGARADCKNGGRFGPSECFESGTFDPTATAVTNDDDYSAGTAVFATGIAMAVTGAVAIVAGIVIGGSGVTIKGDKPSAEKPSDATTPAPANGPRFGAVGRGVGITF